MREGWVGKGVVREGVWWERRCDEEGWGEGLK